MSEVVMAPVAAPKAIATLRGVWMCRMCAATTPPKAPLTAIPR